MRKSRFTTEQIMGFSSRPRREMVVAELCRQHGFSDATFYKSRTKYGGMEAADAQRPRATTHCRD